MEGDTPTETEISTEQKMNETETNSKCNQARLLQRQVNLQGKLVRLNQLVDQNWVEKNIDSATFKEITENDNFPIGDEKAFSSVGYFKNYYQNRQLQSIYVENEIKNQNDFIDPLKKQIRYYNYVVMIENEPGMGKSTFLTSLACEMRDFYHKKLDECDFGLWLIRINLSEHSQTLKKIDFTKNDPVKAIDFLGKLVVPGDPEHDVNIRFQRTFFADSLWGETKTKIVLMFDGLDEVEDDFKRPVTQMMRALRDTQYAQMWLTARPHHYYTYLPTKLSAHQYTLRPLENDQQIKLMDLYWKWHFVFNNHLNRPRTYDEILNELKAIRVNDEKLKNVLIKYPAGLNDKIDDLLQDVNKLDFAKIAADLIKQLNQCLSFPVISNLRKTSINEKLAAGPLHLEIVSTAIFREDFHLSPCLRAFDLFDDFVKYKMKNAAYEWIHIEIAAKMFVGEEYIAWSEVHQDIVDEYKRNLPRDRNIMEDLLQIGLLRLNDNRFFFVHRNFAEYFFSKFVIATLRTDSIRRNTVFRVFNEYDNHVLRRFIDEQLASDENLRSLRSTSLNTILNENLCKYYGGSDYCVFRNISQENYRELFKFLLNNIRYDILKDYGYNIMYSAINGGHVEIVQLLLSHSLTLSPEILKNIMSKPHRDDHSALSQAVFRDCKEINEVILNFLHHELGNDFLAELLLAPGEYGESFINRTIGYSDGSKRSFLKTLLNWQYLDESLCRKLWLDNSSGTRFFKGQTIFHRTILWNYMDTIDEMWQVINKYPEVMKELLLKTDYYGATVLTYLFKPVGTKKTQKELIKEILRVIRKVISNDEAFVEYVIISAWATPRMKSVCQFAPYIINEVLALLDDDLIEVNDQLNVMKKNVSMVHQKNNLLHKAICKEQTDNVKHILTEAQNNNYIRELMLSIPKNVFAAPLQCAVIENAVDIFKQMLKSMGTISPRILAEIILKVDTTGKGTVLNVAARFGYVEIIGELMDFVKTHLSHEVLVELLLKPNENGDVAIKSAHSEKHHEIVKKMFEIALDDPELLVKFVEAIGGGKTTLEWCKDNNYNKLQQQIDQTILGSNLGIKTKLCYAAEPENIEELTKLLNTIENDRLDEIFSDEKTLLNSSKGNFTYNLLRWVKKSRPRNPILRDLVLDVDYEQTMDIGFLEWVVENVESDWPGTMKMLLHKRCVCESRTISALACDNPILLNKYKTFLNWLKNHFAEVFEDVVLATGYYEDQGALFHITLNFNHYFAGGEILLDLLIDRQEIRQMLFLSKCNEFATRMIYRSLEYLKEENVLDGRRIGQRFIDEYRKIGRSLMMSEININDFCMGQLNVLRRNLTDDQEFENKQQIIRFIENILERREKNLQNTSFD